MCDSKFELTLNLVGKIEFHVFLHLDHAALAQTLEQATAKLKSAVKAADKPVPPIPPK